MKKQGIIIKKVNNNDHDGTHDDSWKVAYADFVTAMMAFFLLLWLITMVSPEKRARVAAYFKYFSIYSQSGTSFLGESSEMFNEAEQSESKELHDAKASSISDMEKELKEGILSKLKDSQNQVIVDTIESGVRIQIVDKDGSLMFEKGINKMTPKAREILGVITDNIKSLPNKIAIEGHTDSLQYAGNDYSNWELSTERASSARRELEANGLQPQRIERVSGFADKEPLIADDPSDPRNRRISIILKVPYEDETPAAIADRDTAMQRESKSSVEPKDEGSRMVNKFQENLSLIKTGMNAAEDKNKEKVVHKNTGNTVSGPKDIVEPEIKSWGHVIKKEDWNPVIKDEFKPAMKKSSSVNPDALKSVENQDDNSSWKKADRPILKNIQIPSPEKEETPVTSIQTDNTFYSKKKQKSFSVPKIKENENSAPAEVDRKDLTEIKKLSDPLISKDVLFK